MNGWDWVFSGTCLTCGATERIEGPLSLVTLRRDEYLSNHAVHEFEIAVKVQRPVDVPLEAKLVNITTRGSA